MADLIDQETKEVKSLKQIFFEGLMYNGEGSEKRQTKFVVVSILLGCTIFDTIYNRYLRIEILTAWIGLLTWDGYRSTKEKKDEKSIEKAS